MNRLGARPTKVWWQGRGADSRYSLSPPGFNYAICRGEIHGRKTTPRSADQPVRLGHVPGVPRGRGELSIL